MQAITKNWWVALAVCLSLAGTEARAQDLKAWRGKLEEKLKINGPVDEGTEGDKGSLTKGGTTYDTLTYVGKATVSDPGENGEGTIKYEFEARIRKKRYEGKVEVGTEDSNIKGEITAKYSFTISGKVLIEEKEIKYTSGNEHGAGRCIFNRIKELNGASLK